MKAVGAPHAVREVRRTVDPRAAAQNPARTGKRPLRVFLRRFIVIFVIIPVATPFIYISTHIVYAQFISHFCANRVGLVTAVAIIPGHIANTIAAAVFVASVAVTTAGSIFPFSLGGEPVVLRSFSIQLCDKFLHIIP